MEIKLVSNMKKIRRTFTWISFEIEDSSIEKAIPLDTFAPIIDGKAEIVIDGIIDLLDTDHPIIQSGNPNVVKTKIQFKLISTLIKRKYE